jgi:hypothetical protein
MKIISHPKRKDWPELVKLQSGWAFRKESKKATQKK